MLPAAGEEITRSGRQPVSEREFVIAREFFDFRQEPLDEVVGPRQHVLFGRHAPPPQNISVRASPCTQESNDYREQRVKGKRTKGKIMSWRNETPDHNCGNTGVRSCCDIGSRRRDDSSTRSRPEAHGLRCLQRCGSQSIPTRCQPCPPRRRAKAPPLHHCLPPSYPPPGSPPRYTLVQRTPPPTDNGARRCPARPSPTPARLAAVCRPTWHRLRPRTNSRRSPDDSRTPARPKTGPFAPKSCTSPSGKRPGSRSIPHRPPSGFRSHSGTGRTAHWSPGNGRSGSPRLQRPREDWLAPPSRR